jgi:hypothetical protein
MKKYDPKRVPVTCENCLGGNWLKIPFQINTYTYVFVWNGDGPQDVIDKLVGDIAFGNYYETPFLGCLFVFVCVHSQVI